MPRKLVLFIVIVVSLVGLGAAYLSYSAYAAVWRRPVARTPKCIYSARIILRKPSLISGSEPYPTDSGEMIYLTEKETLAVHCLTQVSSPLAKRFAKAFTETEPSLRAGELVKILRDVPPDEAHDREAAAAYFVGAGAISALSSDIPAVKAADEEMDAIHGCRFLTRLPCAKRPSIPVLVWLTGVPSAIGALAVIGALGYAGVLRLRSRWRARKAKRAQGSTGSTSSTSTPPVALG